MFRAKVAETAEYLEGKQEPTPPAIPNLTSTFVRNRARRSRATSRSASFRDKGWRVASGHALRKIPRRFVNGKAKL